MAAPYQLPAKGLHNFPRPMSDYDVQLLSQWQSTQAPHRCAHDFSATANAYPRQPDLTGGFHQSYCGKMGLVGCCPQLPYYPQQGALGFYPYSFQHANRRPQGCSGAINGAAHNLPFVPAFNLPPTFPMADKFPAHAFREIDPNVPSDGKNHSNAAHRISHDVYPKVAVPKYDEYDHPSYSRPPHRAASRELPAPVVATPLVDAPQRPSETSQPQVMYDLVSNTSTVPQAPPVEKSAVPLENLAINFIWTACSRADVSPINSVGKDFSSMPGSWSYPPRRGSTSRGRASDDHTRSHANDLPFESSSPIYQRSFPQTPELFGRVTDARHRKINSDGSLSDVSTPASSAPGTPAGIWAVDAVGRSHRRSGWGLGLTYTHSDAKAELDIYGRSGQADASRMHIARIPSAGRNSYPIPSEPTAAFSQFVKQVLTATLVTPEDILLALFYANNVPMDQLVSLVPAAAPTLSTGSLPANAMRAAPFRLFMGALIVANKILQDNSYRNETFSTVSGIPVKELNELENAIIRAIGFNLIATGDAWANWISAILERHSTDAFSGYADAQSHNAATAILQRALQSSQGSNRAFITTSSPRPPIVAPPLPLVNLHLLSYEDCDIFDDAGPLRSPIRFSNPTGRTYFPVSDSRTPVYI